MKRKIPNLFEESTAPAAVVTPAISLVRAAPEVATAPTEPPAIDTPSAVEGSAAIAVEASPQDAVPPAPAQVAPQPRAKKRQSAPPVEAAAPELKKVTFWITQEQHELLFRRTAARMAAGERVQISNVVREAIDAHLK